jgi:hypothetical protein
MKIVKSFLELTNYLFYRILKANRNFKDKEEITIFLISIFYGLMIAIPFSLIRLHILGAELAKKNLNPIKSISIFIMIIILILNYLRFNGKSAEIIDKWKNESESAEKWRGVLVILALLFPFIIMFVDIALR